MKVPAPRLEKTSGPPLPPRGDTALQTPCSSPSLPSLSLVVAVMVITASLPSLLDLRALVLHLLVSLLHSLLRSAHHHLPLNPPYPSYRPAMPLSALRALYRSRILLRHHSPSSISRQEAILPLCRLSRSLPLLFALSLIHNP